MESRRYDGAIHGRSNETMVRNFFGSSPGSCSDPTAVTAAFGCHVVQTEADEVMHEFRQVAENDAAVAAKRELILSFFDTPNPKSDPVTTRLTEPDLAMAVRAAVALGHFIEARQLDGLACYYEGEPDSELRKAGQQFHCGQLPADGGGLPDVRRI